MAFCHENVGIVFHVLPGLIIAEQTFSYVESFYSLLFWVSEVTVHGSAVQRGSVQGTLVESKETCILYHVRTEGQYCLLYDKDPGAGQCAEQ